MRYHHFEINREQESLVSMCFAVCYINMVISTQNSLFKVRIYSFSIKHQPVLWCSAVINALQRKHTYTVNKYKSVHFPHFSRQVFDINNNVWAWKNTPSVKMRGTLVNSIKRLQSRRNGMWIQNPSISNTEITVDCKGFFFYQKRGALCTEKKSIFILEVSVKWSTWALSDNLLSWLPWFLCDVTRFQFVLG